MSWTVGRILISLAVVVALWGLRWLVNTAIARHTLDPRVRYRWRKATTYIVVVLGLVLVARVWWEGMRGFATYLGLLSAGVAVALREPIVNLFGWAYISWRRPFVVGDRVTIGELTGDVVDIGAFSFALLEVGGWVGADQSTGRIVHVPNGKVFSEAVANYTQGFDYVWHEIPVTVTFESNWKRAKEVLLEIARDRVGHVAEEAPHYIQRASRRFLITYSALTPTVYTKIVDNGVQLTLRYLVQPRKRRDAEHEISEAVLEEFGKLPDVDFAYPTWRIFDQKAEGKPALRPRGETSA